MAADEALGRLVILLEALHASISTAPRVRAVLAALGALLRHPLGWSGRPGRHAGSAHAQALAVPGLAVCISRIGARDAAGLTAGPPVVLPVAGGAGLLAAPCLVAVLTRVRATLLDPGRRLRREGRRLVVTFRPLAHGLAHPHAVVCVRGVRARVAARPAQRPELVLLHVALCSRDLAALRCVAVLIHPRALHLLGEDLLTRHTGRVVRPAAAQECDEAKSAEKGCGQDGREAQPPSSSRAPRRLQQRLFILRLRALSQDNICRTHG
mmetsp:Transcript_21341/g.60456  ORF Transcript_21341/g.60456 Transcript_21341/m.60456 type:complete len:267 (+) Transcript_21341:1117-1917(+)